MDKQKLLKQVKQKILEIEPGATIILYGSRSRGDATKDSDWDFLILVNKRYDYKQVEKIRNHLFEVELQSDEILSSIIRSRAEWNSPKYMLTPFYKNVEKEGVVL